MSGLLRLFKTHKKDLKTVQISKVRTEKEKYSDKVDFYLPWSRIYVCFEPKAEFSFEVFSDMVKKRCFECEINDSFVCESIYCASCTLECPCKTCDTRRPRGLVISRRHPAIIRKEYNLQTTPVIWLTTIYGSYTINPEKLGTLEKTVIDFIKDVRKSVIIMEGLEYLIQNNGFLPVLRMIENINDIVMTRKSILILPVDERTLEKADRAYLERNTYPLRKYYEAGKENGETRGL